MIRTPVAPLTQPATEHLEHHNGTAKRVPSHAPDDGRYVSKEEYWAIWYDYPDASYEWNNGYLEAKPLPNPVQFNLYTWFLTLLRQYLQVHQNGQLMGLETGFALTVPDLKLLGRLKETVRKPDIAVIRDDNPIVWGKTERSYRGICDLCVESLSDSSKVEVERDTKVKKMEYEFAGVQEYYILDPSDEHRHFYQRTPAGDYVEIQPDAEGVIHSVILPDFQFRLRDLHDLPTPEMLALDEVYQGYMLLEYQAALTQAKAERARVAAARLRTKAERRRAEAEAVARQLAEARAEAEAVARQLAEARAEAERQRAVEEQQRAEARAEASNAALQQSASENARLLAELAQLRKGATGAAEGDKAKR